MPLLPGRRYLSHKSQALAATLSGVRGTNRSTFFTPERSFWPAQAWGFRGVAAQSWGRHRAGFTPERSLWPAQAWEFSWRCRSSLVFSQGPASWPASRRSSDPDNPVSAKDRWRCRGHSSRVRKGVCSRLPSDQEHTRIAGRYYFAERFAASLPSPCVSSGARAEACRFSR